MRLIPALALALLATSAVAQEPPVTDGQIAAARAQADQLVAAADAQAWFENVTDSVSPEVRHRPSGMRCRFTGSRSDRIAVFQTGPAGIPQGDDVGCVTRDEALAIDLTLYATRYRPLPSEDVILADAVNAILNRYPGAQPYRGDLVSMSIDDDEPPVQAAYEVMMPEGPMLTIALVEHLDEWGFKARVTGPQPDAMEVSLYGSLMLVGALLERD